MEEVTRKRCSLMTMKIYRDADLEKIGILVPGQDEDVQQELDTYVELGQRRGRGTQVSIVHSMLDLFR